MSGWFRRELTDQDYRMASAYLCPKCGSLPHVQAVRKAQSKLKGIPEQAVWVRTVRDMSQRVCPVKRPTRYTREARNEHPA